MHPPICGRYTTLCILRLEGIRQSPAGYPIRRILRPLGIVQLAAGIQPLGLISNRLVGHETTARIWPRKLTGEGGGRSAIKAFPPPDHNFRILSCSPTPFGFLISKTPHPQTPINIPINSTRNRRADMAAEADGSRQKKRGGCAHFRFRPSFLLLPSFSAAISARSSRVHLIGILIGRCGWGDFGN